MNKKEIAAVLTDIAELLELKGENAFKVRAYANGARTLETLEADLGSLIEEEQLGSVKGIGSALVEKITTLYETGELRFYNDLKASIPPGLLEMMEIPGLGPKKIKKIHDALGITTIEELRVACESGAVAELPGMGAKSAEKILSGISNRESYLQRHRWYDAEEVAGPILRGLRALPEVERAESAGSLRRLMETVGDLDFIVASQSPGPIMEWFTSLPEVREVTAKGETKSSIRLESGLQADLRVVPPEQFFFALHHFTGSKEHNVAMRSRALEKGYSLSEWGLSPKDRKGSAKAAGETVESEEALFAKLDLPFIPPELREGRGEIEAAEQGKLPKLVSENDLRGVFHNHTTASDGHDSLEDMTAAAEALGWDYWGLADHSKTSFQANGQDEAAVLVQAEKVRKLNASGRFTTHIFMGVECDILKDGSLDLDDACLRELDYVVVSVHNATSLSETEMTQRLIRALEHPSATILGHATGRLLLRREPYAVNLEKVIDAAIANRKIIELNANPYRLDMDWRYWRRAAERGLRCAINPDAHSADNFAFYRTGVNIARKGWLTPEQVVNTWPLEQVQALFRDLHP